MTSHAALIAGRIGFAHVGLLAETATAVDATATAAAPFDEARLLRQAETLGTALPLFDGLDAAAGEVRRCSGNDRTSNRGGQLRLSGGMHGSGTGQPMKVRALRLVQ